MKTVLLGFGLILMGMAACDRVPEGFDAGGTGGIPGAGGAIGAGGAGGQPCAAGTVSFQLLPGALDSSMMWCQDRPGPCGAGWHVSIKDAAGEVLTMPSSCRASCSTCQMMACALVPTICMPPQPVSAGGETSSWDGRVAKEGACGPSSTPCQSVACAARGRYTAVMCAYPAPLPDGGQACMQDTGTEPVCVEVPFDYPAAGPVVGALP